MPKYVLTENGNIKIQDGKPLVEGDDGSTYTVDAIGAQDRITALNAENADFRKKASSRKKELERFEGIDPDAARAALTTVDNLSTDHKLEIENLTKSMNETWQSKLDAKDKEIQDLNTNLFESNVKGRFATSPTAETLLLPPDIACDYFGKNFRNDGTAVDSKGNVIYSKEQPGVPAGFEEALQVLIDQYPHKERILKGSGATGSGGHRAGDGRSNDLASFYDPNSHSYSVTEQSKLANSNPELHKSLKASAPAKKQ